jgi:hypothetical protein
MLVTLSLTALALTYVPDYVGQHRIYVQGSSDPDTARTASSDPDPYHQRYY